MKKAIRTEHFFFCAFSDSDSVMKHVVCKGDTEFYLFLSDQVLQLHYQQGSFLVNLKPMASDSMQLADSERFEKVILYRHGPVETLPATGRIRLEESYPVTLGSDFENKICYQFHSRVRGRHAVLVPEGQKVILHNLAGEGLYCNEKKAKESTVLNKGDIVQLYGLSIQFLPPYLVYVPLAGECRTPDWGFSEKDFQKDDKRADMTEAVRGICRLPAPPPLPEEQEKEILTPPQRKESSRTPWILSIGPSVTMVFPILIMSLLSMKYGSGSSGYQYITFAAGICSSLLGVFWGMTNRIATRQEERRSNRDTSRQYREYLGSLENELSDLSGEFLSDWRQRYPAVRESFLNAHVLGIHWNRYESEEDFWFIRLGTGKRRIPLKWKLEEGRKSIVKNPLMEEAEAVKDRFQYVEQAPVGVDFKENDWLGVVGKEEHLLDGVLEIFWQQVLSHTPEELHVACFFDKEVPWQQMFCRNMKWIPHIWSETGETRFLAGDREEAAEILPDLTKELSAKDRKGFFLIFLLNPEMIQGEVLQSLLLDKKTEQMMAVGVANTESELQKEFRSRMVWKAGCKELQLSEKGMRKNIPIQYDVSDLKEALSYSRCFALCERNGEGKKEGIPNSVGFLELFECQHLEELHCELRWLEASPEKRLKAAIGRGAHGRVVFLDIHEKFHGPHGLIAGTTGSGKSELIQTYLLSLSIQYSPQDVNFFVLDYKGGGTGNMVCRLPHCAGVISNLSGGQIRRAMLAISSENKKREQTFVKYGVNHIDAYMRLYRDGKAEASIPHLLIVIDEFAELKKEEPEFMKEVISLAQVGRSLGVHLILATQKPSGTVDDKIWSNARFHLCLRVQDKQDSMDMLHKPDASYLTAPGQCYLQIGNDELYQQFQTAYCGGKYQPGIKKEQEVALLSETGRRSVLPKENSSNDEKLLMEYVTDYVCHVAEENGYERAGQLWLPELKETIFLEDKGAHIRKENGRFRIGMYDDPENQCQKLLYYEPQKQGHLGICGGPATGKSHFLRLLMEQIAGQYDPSEAEYFLIAMDQPGFSKYERLPHCLGFVQNPRELTVFFYQLKKLWNQRKQALNGESYQSFVAGNTGKLPILFGLIDGIAMLRKYLGEMEEEFLLSMAAEGISLGVYLIITGNGVTDFQSKLWNKIKTTIALEMSDPFQYGDVLRQYQGIPIPKEGVAGRGICKLEKRALEFQTLTFQKEGRTYLDGVSFYERMMRVPEHPELMQFLTDFQNSRGYEEGRGRLPVGYNKETGEMVSLDLKKLSAFLISGADQTGKSSLVCNMLISAVRVTDWKILLLDMDKEYDGLSTQPEILYGENPSGVEKELEEVLFMDEKILVILPDLASFIRAIYYDNRSGKINVTLWEKLVSERKSNVFVMGAFHPQRDSEVYGTPFFQSLSSYQCGVHLGGNAALQRTLEFDGISFARLNRAEPPGNGFLKMGAGGESVLLLIPENAKHI